MNDKQRKIEKEFSDAEYLTTKLRQLIELEKNRSDD